MLRKFMFVAGLSLSSLTMADVGKLKAAAGVYDAKGKELMALINAGKVDAAKADALVTEMVAQAKVLADAYAAKDSKSAKLMKFVTDSIGKMKGMSFETLQKDWHDGGAYSPAAVGLDVKKEENEKYLDPVHTIVHPIMTLVAVKGGDMKSAKEELAEGLEQVQGTLEVLTK